MSDYFTPRKAVLISPSRSGSTFLLNALDSHYQIGCERSEPLDPITSPWRDLNLDYQDLMQALWRRPGYRISMFKVSYRQVKWISLDLLKENNVSILHLHRQNVIRTIVSSFINTAAVKGELVHPIHSFEPAGEPARIRLDPTGFAAKCKDHLLKIEQVVQVLKNLDQPTCFLTYEELVGYEGNEASEIQPKAAKKICDFLNVDDLPLYAETKRVNPYPLEKVVTNWIEVQEVLIGNGLGEYL